MPLSRDRLSTQDSIIASYSQRRVSRTGDRSTSISFVLEDDNEEGQNARTPFRWRDTTLVGDSGSAGAPLGTPGIRPQILSPLVGSGHSRGGSFGTPKIRRIARPEGQENLSPVVGSGHGRRGTGGSPLPAWYPRRPLNDIAAVVRAIERRNERGGDGEDPQAHDQASMPSAHLEQNKAMVSPLLVFSNKPRSIGKVPKILLDITHQKGGGAACMILIPQKKLLNCIDTVEKVVMGELRQMKPSAKRADKEKRVRTLMSMR
ncbi:uv-b-insensitive 4 [Salvia divinorum]|uniref:Uv-b-insensitive 4 n=1 Tax=Salvia divinorum TaxID=28513 RepID=A0ABD1HEB5_SALDI